MIRRYMPRTKASNAKEAATMAIEDAGLKVSDIDGIFIWANPNWGNIQGPSVWLDVNQMMQVMPWENIKFWLQPEAVAAGSCSGIQCAALALGAGAVNYALVIRTGHHPAGVRYRQISTNRAPGNAAFSNVYGHGVGGAGQAVGYQRYLSKYNAKREEMWGYIGTAHRNGQDTPQSVWKGRMISEEDYLNAHAGRGLGHARGGAGSTCRRSRAPPRRSEQGFPYTPRRERAPRGTGPEAQP